MQDYTSQHYTSQDHTNQLTGTAQQLQLLQIYIIADHMQILVFTLKTTSKTATRTASSSCSFEKIPLHLIPFSLILLELKAHCSGYVVFKTSANVFSFLDKNSLIKLLCSSRAEGRITRENLVHFRKNLKHKSYRKVQKSYKNPQNL